MQLNMYFNDRPADCQADLVKWKQCVQAHALHEFGHVLGLGHAEGRPDAPDGDGDCARQPVPPDPQLYGAHDIDSVMSYCGQPNHDISTWKTQLSPNNIASVQMAYGRRQAGQLVNARGADVLASNFLVSPRVFISDGDDADGQLWRYDFAEQAFEASSGGTTVCLDSGNPGAPMSAQSCIVDDSQRFPLTGIYLRGFGGLAPGPSGRKHRQRRPAPGVEVRRARRRHPALDHRCPNRIRFGSTKPPTVATTSTRRNITGSFENLATRTCITVASAGNANGTAVESASCNGTVAQEWDYSSARDRDKRPNHGKQPAVPSRRRINETLAGAAPVLPSPAMRLLGALVVVGFLVSGCGKVSKGDDGDDGDDDGTTSDADPDDGSPGDDDGSPGNDGSPTFDAAILPACSEPPPCAEAGELNGAADLVTVTEGCLEWGQSAVDRYNPRSPTYIATQAISVCSEDFTLPVICQGDEILCNANIQISVDPDLEGADETAFCPNPPGAQFAAGMRFRIRYKLEPPFPGFPNHTAHLRFERPCDAECLADETRCEAIDNCYDDPDVCFACGRGTLDECACRTPDNGVLADCTACEYIEGDILYVGACFDGRCSIEVCDDGTCTCQ